VTGGKRGRLTHNIKMPGHPAGSSNNPQASYDADNAGSKKPAIKKPAVSPLTEEELEAAKLQRAKSRRRANKFAD